MTKPAAATLERRQVLKTLGAGVGVAAAATIRLAGGPAVASEAEDEKRKARYRQTDHVKTFYRVNRYPKK